MRLHGRLPAGCRQAAGIAIGIAAGTSGWAEAPGDVSHRRCTRWRGRRRGVGRAVCPQAAAMRLGLRLRLRLGLRLEPAVGRKPPAMFRTEGARAGEGVGRAVCPQAAAMRLTWRLGLRLAETVHGT